MTARVGFTKDIAYPEIRFADDYANWDVCAFGNTVNTEKNTENSELYQNVAFKAAHVSADKLKSIKADGPIRLLSTGSFDGHTDTAELEIVNDMEIVAFPSGGTANLKYYKGKFIDGGNILCQSKNSSNSLYYIFLCLQAQKKEIEQLYRGVSIKHPAMNEIMDLPVSLPSSHVQSEIASLFSRLDARIASETKTVEQLRVLKSAMLQNMFPREGERVPRVRFEGFTGEWEERKLGELSERIIVGLATSVTPYYRTEGTPIFRNLNIKENYLDDSDILFLDEAYANRQTSKKIHTGDVLTVHTGYIGTSCVVPEKYNDCLTFTTLITTTDVTKLSGEFLSQYLNSEMGLSAVQMVTTQGGRQNLNTNDFVNVMIPYPSVDEQEKICGLLRSLDNTITLHQRKFEKFEQLKKAVLKKMII